MSEAQEFVDSCEVMADRRQVVRSYGRDGELVGVRQERRVSFATPVPSVNVFSERVEIVAFGDRYEAMVVAVEPMMESADGAMWTRVELATIGGPLP